MITYIRIYSDHQFLCLSNSIHIKKIHLFIAGEISQIAHRFAQDEVQQLLVVTFSAQGAPVAQGQAEVRALRDALLKAPEELRCFAAGPGPKHGSNIP